MTAPESSELPAEEVPAETSSTKIVNAVTAVSFCGVFFAVYELCVVVPKYIATFKALRVDLPVPTKIVLGIAHMPSLVLVFLGVSIVLLELIRRQRSNSLAVAAMIAALLVGPIAHESIMLPLSKIQDQLGKKP